MLSTLTLGACATGANKVDPTKEIEMSPPPCAVFAFDGPTGQVISWREVLDRTAKAQVVFVGETHDDATAHLIEHALVDAFLAAHPHGAVSMEFLERDDQKATDEYLAGTISLDEFVDKTHSRDWAGKDSWIPWYQPMIDSARRSHGRVVAANAPRKYVSRARTEGYEVLKALPADEQALFEIDAAITRDDDWTRLKKLMSQMHRDRAASSGEGPTEPTDESIDQVHRSQRMWDRTMGTSAARAFQATGAVIHVVGGFHIEGRLGTAAQFSGAGGTKEFLVISLQPDDQPTLTPNDAAPADIVIHTKALRYSVK